MKICSQRPNSTSPRGRKVAYGPRPCPRSRRVQKRQGAGIIFTFQSNHEGELIEKIHAARSLGILGILINPAGYTHTSVAIRDALLGVGIPFIEIHISNVAAREPFRQKNLFSDIAVGTISGLGPYGYILGIEALHALLGTETR